MTEEEIIEMARKAGFFINDKLTITSPFIEDICISPMLKEFAKLVAEKEREEIIKEVENALYGQEGCGKAAKAIRERGKE